MRRFLAALLLLVASPAVAEPWCKSRDQINEVIAATAMELVASGKSNQDYIVEWFANPKGHWMVVYTNVDPLLICIVAHGVEFRLSMIDDSAPLDI